MVVSILLDLTLDFGFWVVTRVGAGVVGLARYAFSEGQTTEEPLAIEPAHPATAEALDAAAVLHVHGALNDKAYVDVVRSLVAEKIPLTTTRMGSDAKSTNDERTFIEQPALPPALPSAPPAYKRLFDGKLNLEGS